MSELKKRIEEYIERNGRLSTGLDIMLLKDCLSHIEEMEKSIHDLTNSSLDLVEAKCELQSKLTAAAPRLVFIRDMGDRCAGARESIPVSEVREFRWGHRSITISLVNGREYEAVVGNIEVLT